MNTAEELSTTRNDFELKLQRRASYTSDVARLRWHLALERITAGARIVDDRPWPLQGVRLLWLLRGVQRYYAKERLKVLVSPSGTPSREEMVTYNLQRTYWDRIKEGKTPAALAARLRAAVGKQRLTLLEQFARSSAVSALGSGTAKAVRGLEAKLELVVPGRGGCEVLSFKAKAPFRRGGCQVLRVNTGDGEQQRMYTAKELVTQVIEALKQATAVGGGGDGGDDDDDDDDDEAEEGSQRKRLLRAARAALHDLIELRCGGGTPVGWRPTPALLATLRSAHPDWLWLKDAAVVVRGPRLRHGWLEAAAICGTVDIARSFSSCLSALPSAEGGAAPSFAVSLLELPPALRPGAQRPNPFQTPRERHRKAQSGRGAERHAHDMPMICP